MGRKRLPLWLTCLLTFVKRCTRLLRQIIYAAPQQTFEEDTHPSYFQDEEVRKWAESLHLHYAQKLSTKITAKKRKVVKTDGNPLYSLLKALHETVDMAPSDDQESISEQQFL